MLPGGWGTQIHNVNILSVISSLCASVSVCLSVCLSSPPVALLPSLSFSLFPTPPFLSINQASLLVGVRGPEFMVCSVGGWLELLDYQRGTRQMCSVSDELDTWPTEWLCIVSFCLGQRDRWARLGVTSRGPI